MGYCLKKVKQYGYRCSQSFNRPAQQRLAAAWRSACGWFSRFVAKQRPNPNWEYYVQVAEYVRLSTALAGHGYELTFEDDLMDIGVYSQGRKGDKSNYCNLGRS